MVTDNSLQQELVREFKRRFGALPAFVVRAPSRANLIGEHSDYNDGFVLPMTIDRATWIALRPRSDKRVVVHSLDFKAAAEFNLDSLKKGRETWAEYIKGVAWVLQNAGHKLHGWDGVVVSNVPIGAGLSSSVALELATARTFAMVSVLQWNAAEMARLCLHSTGSFRVARNNLFIGDAGCAPFRK